MKFEEGKKNLSFCNYLSWNFFDSKSYLSSYFGLQKLMNVLPLHTRVMRIPRTVLVLETAISAGAEQDSSTGMEIVLVSRTSLNEMFR